MTTTESSSKTRWVIDPAHSEIEFKVRHLMIAHIKGSFRIFDASIYTTGKDFTTAEIDVWIDTLSINTGNEERDEHLKSPAFFDAMQHQQINFRSLSMSREEGSDDTYELWGELSMHGITKSVKLEVEFGGIERDPYGKEKAGFSVTGTINRYDWNLIWNSPTESGGVMVSEDVKISCDIQLINSGQQEAETDREAERQSQPSA